MKKISALLLSFLIAIPQGIASQLPDLGESSRQYLTDKQEKEIARSIMRDIFSSPSYLADAEVEAYLNTLGVRLAAESTASGRTLTLFAMHEPSINAFALPGGYIGVHTGLILSAENESELAGVLAHEVAHVSQEHLSRMIAQQDQSYLPTLAALAIAILAARSNANVGSAAIATAQAVSIQGQLNFTREHEREADRVGLEILANANFDPRGLSSFFNKLQRTNRLYDNNAPDYLRTHPLNSQRIADMDGRVENFPYKQVRDSNEFHLVRARLSALEENPDEAIKRFQDQIRQKKTPLEEASRYGLALALARQGKHIEAEKEVALAKKSVDSPMLLNLGAELAAKLGDLPRAQTIYHSALNRYPHYKPLIYGYGMNLILGGKPKEALSFLSVQSSLWPEDSRIWKLLARANASLGRKLASHAAEAESMAAEGNVPAALEQINLGIKSGDGDFYELSAAEARRREWQEYLSTEAGKK